MSLALGFRLGAYEIVSQLGAGGMGEVYRARDTKLDRDVALKVLPESFIHDPDRLARFQREAKVLASLNHPNIAHIHGLEESDGIQALVMELVEGEDLAQRLARGAIPIDEALPIARQIAEALEAAHDQGIIHRDLKPANIKVRDDGMVKVLDFGLAKALDPVGTPADMSMSPTITTPAMTQAGMILGTAAYMSPEQAKGKPADKRSDIWAFGCVLYEMLTGVRSFQGDDVAETLAEVIKGTPDWSRLPPLPPAIRLLLRRCCEKDRRQRLADASSIQLLLSEPSIVSESTVSLTSAPGASWPRLAIAAFGGAALVAVVGWFTRAEWLPPPPAAQVTRWAVTLDAGERFSNTGRQTIAVAPDGRMIAWTSNSRLIVQSLESRTPRPLTDYSAVAVINPVFSPDGQSIVFQSGGVLRRVSVRGGTAAVLTPPLNGTVFGLNWMPDGIYYGELKTSDLSGPTRIQRLSPSDGTLTTIAESLPGETFFAPSSLPKNRGTLVTLAKGNSATRWEQSQLIVILPSGERRTVLTGAADGRYLPTGQLAYSAGGVVFAAPFDLDTLAVSGAAAPILEGVARGYPTTGATQYAFSASGTLVYLPGPASLVETGRTLAAFSMDGSFARLATRPDRYEFARVSPDGAFLAVGANSDAGADIWIVDLSGKSDRRRVTQEGRNRFPVWSPDSRRIAFQSTRQDGHGIYWQAADGSGRAERLTTAEAGVEHVPMAWAPDKTLVFEVVKSPRWSLWTLSLPSGTTRQLIPDDSASPMTPVFSPDGKWLAYHTQAFTASSRRDTVWIRRFPIDENRWEVSSEGSSHHPLWINSGRQLLYIVGAGQWIVRDLISGATPSFAPARSLPSLIAPTAPSTVETRTFDLLSDGRIAADTGNAVVAAGSVAAITQTIEVVEHWFEELKARVPTK